MLTLSDFDFPLPPELIAQTAALPERSASRLLVVERVAAEMAPRPPACWTALRRHRRLPAPR